MSDNIRVVGLHSRCELRTDGHGARYNPAQRGGHRQSLHGRPKNLTKVLPVRDRFRAPFRFGIAGKLQVVGLAGAATLRQFLHVRNDCGIQIQADHLNVFRLSKLQPRHRFEYSERLQCLQRIEIISIAFIGEIQAGPDDRNSMHAAWRQDALANHGAQRLFEGKVG